MSMHIIDAYVEKLVTQIICMQWIYTKALAPEQNFTCRGKKVAMIFTYSIRSKKSVELALY